MTTIREQITTDLPLTEAFDYVADFASAAEWDPGVESARRLGNPAEPIRVGTRYELQVRMGGRTAPMEYEITKLEAPNRVVLAGKGSGVSAVDDIRFEESGGRTRIEYIADIRMGGLLRLAQPFMGSIFARIGRDAAGGMQKTLDGRVAPGPSDS